jgi:GNAT superfamily N-acetyltransferase
VFIAVSRKEQFMAGKNHLPIGIRCCKWSRCDLDTIAELIVSCWRSYDSSKVHPGMKRSFLNWLKTVFGSRTHHFVVARDRNGTVVGITGIQKLGGRPTAELHSVCVRAKLRRCGIGRRLLKTAIRIARQLGYTRLVLGAVKSPKALKLYESVGFRRTIDKETCVRMSLRLAPQ